MVVNYKTCHNKSGCGSSANATYIHDGGLMLGQCRMFAEKTCLYF